MKALIFLSIILCIPTFALATNTAEYCLEGTLVDTKNNTQKSSMKCEVAQKLTWEDYSVLFQCNFDGNNDSIFTSASGLGSDFGASAWTIYDLKNSESGQFLAKGLNLSKVKKAQDIKIMYTNKVWSKDEFVIVEDSSGIYKLNLKAYLGKCQTN